MLDVIKLPMKSKLCPDVTASNCSVDNGDCDHECSESDGGTRRSCSCLNGYKLDDDSRKCSPKSESDSQPRIS